MDGNELHRKTRFFDKNVHLRHETFIIGQIEDLQREIFTQNISQLSARNVQFLRNNELMLLDVNEHFVLRICFVNFLPFE